MLIWLEHAVRSAISAPSAPVSRPRKHQTSHADDVAAKDAPLKSLFPSEPVRTPGYLMRKGSSEAN